MNRDNLWNDFMEIKDMLGCEELLSAILRAMSTKEMEEMLKFLKSEYDIETSFHEEDFMLPEDFEEA